MDIGLRESLIIIGMIVIAGILFDGYRRMKINRRRTRELSLGMGAGLQDNAEDFSNELPNGGARVVAHTAFDEMTDDVPINATATLDPEPPLINTTVVMTQNDSDGRGDSSDDSNKVTPLQRYTTENKTHSGKVKKKAPTLETEDENSDEILTADKEDHYSVPPVVKPATRVVKKATKRVMVKEPSPADARQPNTPVTEEVIIINVVSKTTEGYEGNALLQAMLANGLKFGEMQIFHRHEQPDGKGTVLFSAANGVEPGVFDLSAMEQLKTSVVSLFMSLPGPPDPMKAFEEMAMAAYYLAKTLQGDLKDEQHSVMTQQTLEHCRQRIMDYERRDLVRKQSFQ